MTQFELSNHIIRNVADIKPTSKLLLLTIVSFGGDNNHWKCWPSQNTLGEMMGITPRQVRDHLTVLRQAGYISTEQRNDNSLIYTIEVANLLKTSLPAEEKGSTLRKKKVVGAEENHRLTNHNQTIEQTIIKTIKEDTEVIEEMTSPSTVYSFDLPQCIEFTSSSDAFQYVQSMGDLISWKDFGRVFGSTCCYDNDNLNIHIKRVM